MMEMDEDDIVEVPIDSDSPCVICTAPCYLSGTLKSQSDLTIALCNKLYRLYYSEFVSLHDKDKECRSIPVFDFTKECLPFCLNCRRELLEGVKFCERIQSNEVQLEGLMSKLRKRAVDSWTNQGELWEDWKLGLLRQTMVKNFSSTSDETLSGVLVKDSVNKYTMPFIIGSLSEFSESVNRHASVTSGDSITSNAPSTLLNDETPMNENVLLASPGPVPLTLEVVGNDQPLGQYQHQLSTIIEEEEECGTPEPDTDVIMEDEVSVIEETHVSHYHYYFSDKQPDNVEVDGVQMMNPSDYVKVIIDEEIPPELLPPLKTIQIPEPNKKVKMSAGTSKSGSRNFFAGNKRRRTKQSVQRTYHCRDCGNVFRSYQGLMVHARIHWGHNCTLCRQQFRTRAEMEEHYIIVHSVKMEKTGGKSFDNQDDLDQYHEVETFNTFHSTNVPQFSRISNPTNHIDVQNNQPNEFSYFECQQCSQGFASAELLQNHLQTHNPVSGLVAQVNVQNGKKQKPVFPCVSCKRSYERKKCLENHIAQCHSGVQNQKQRLPAVQKQKQSDPAVRKKRRPSNGKFPCQYCHKAFSYANNRRRHVTQAHFGQPGQPV